MMGRNVTQRYKVAAIILCLAGILLVGRLFWLTVFQYDQWSESAEELSTRQLSVKAPRGRILDRNGEVLAGNRSSFSVKLISEGIDDERLNNVIIKVLTLFEKNGDPFLDNCPIEQETDGSLVYKDSHAAGKWLEAQGLENVLSAPEAFIKLSKRYKIDENVSFSQARQIISIRCQDAGRGYRKYEPLTIASGVSKETVIQLKELSHDFPEIQIEETPVRYYPNKETACHLLGYMGSISEAEKDFYLQEGYQLSERVGASGMEKVLETALKGTDGYRKIQVNAYGQYVRTLEKTPAEPGKDVNLSIDIELQKTAEKALSQALEKIQAGGIFESSYGNYSYGRPYPNANAGAVAAVDVNSGQVLALASNPGFDPNLFSEGISETDWIALQGEDSENPLAPRPLYNISALTAVQPGSTFKPVTALAALHKGMDPLEKYYDGGAVRIGDRTFGCSIWNASRGSHGYLDLYTALEVSCNFYFYNIGAGMDLSSKVDLPVEVGISDVLEMADRLGLGQKTGIEIPESSGSLPNKADSSWTTGERLNLSIGQGEHSYTVLQMVRYISTVANGGTLYPLTLLRDKYLDGRTGTEAKGVFEKNPHSAISLGVDDDQAFAVVREGMIRSATGKAGTARGIFSTFPWTAGAKTGTAQRDGYDNFAWFVAFAPAEKPEIAVAVLILQGGSGSYAGPVAREVIGKYMEQS